MNKLTGILLLGQVLLEKPPWRSIRWFLLLLLVFVAMIVGAFAAFYTIDRIVWGF